MLIPNSIQLVVYGTRKRRSFYVANKLTQYHIAFFVHTVPLQSPYELSSSIFYNIMGIK